LYKVDLNSDLGESFGAWKMGCDELVTDHVTSVNIACGWHAGDPIVLDKTLKLVKEKGICAGAHPGYPDLMGFGRRNLAASPAEVKAYVTYQLGAYSAFATANNVAIQHVKPHGAMYNMAGANIDLARAICEAVAEFDSSIILLGLAGSKLIEAAKEMGLRAASEVFADRGYNDDGSLADRRKPGAFITDEDEAIARVIRMIKDGKVRTITGNDIDVCCDSICVHGDGEKALAFVSRIRAELTANDIAIQPLSAFI